MNVQNNKWRFADNKHSFRSYNSFIKPVVSESILNQNHVGLLSQKSNSFIHSSVKNNSENPIENILSQKINDDIKTRKIIINQSRGIFDFSNEFYKKYKEIYKHEFNFSYENNIKFRSDYKIIKIFEQLEHRKASSILSDLQIVLIPEELFTYLELHIKDGYDFLIINYDKAYADLLFHILNNNILTNNYIIEEYKNKVDRIKYIQKNYTTQKINNQLISKLKIKK